MKHFRDRGTKEEDFFSFFLKRDLGYLYLLASLVVLKADEMDSDTIY